MKESLEALVAEFVARREDGEELSAEAFAAEHPGVEVELLAALDRLGATEELFPRHEHDRPTRIGPYRVVGELGSGGMGRVLRVVHEERPGEPLALKLLHVSAQLNPRVAQRFEREVRVLGRVRHPGVVRVRDAGRSGAESYLVMDLVEGVSLARAVEAARGRPPVDGGSSADRLELGGSGDGVRRAAEVVAQLARAVGALHAAGCVHRDLKPSNAILDREGRPVLIDFGLAGSDDSSTLTHTGDVIGTPHYMAPEQARGERVDARADVWALGAILYELLALHPPHEGSDAVHVLQAIRRRPIPSIRRREPRVPVPLVRVLARALNHRPAGRYPDARALADDLEAFLAGRPVGARRRLADRASDLWRFHRTSLVAGTGLAALVLVLWSAWPRSGVDRDEALRRAIDRTILSWVVDDVDTMRAGARRVLTLEPGNPTGEFLLSLAEGSVLVDSEDPAVEALIRGVTAEGGGGLAEARAHYRRAAELDPASPLPLIMLGMIGDETGELERRVVDLQRALEENPDSAAAARALGVTLHRLERFDEAVDVLERAVANDPDFAKTYGDLALARFHAGDPEAGLETARAASARLGSAGDRVLMEYSVLLSMNGHVELARAELLDLLPRRPDDPDVHCQIARTYDFAERIREAADWYARALELEPDHVESLKGLFHLHAGANRETCEECAAAFEAHPELLDPDRVAEYGERLLRLVEGENLGLTLWIVNTALKVDRVGPILRTLEELLDRDLPPERIDNLEQALHRAESR